MRNKTKMARKRHRLAGLDKWVKEKAVGNGLHFKSIWEFAAEKRLRKSKIQRKKIKPDVGKAEPNQPRLVKINGKWELVDI